MGAWGVDSFENDDALDWIGGLDRSSAVASVSGALGKVIQGPQPEAPECCECLAAAELVAASRGFPSPSLPETATVLLWKGEEKLVPLAIQAVERVTADSELRDLWNDSDSAEDWSKSVQDLLRRLNARGGS